MYVPVLLLLAILGNPTFSAVQGKISLWGRCQALGYYCHLLIVFLFAVDLNHGTGRRVRLAVTLVNAVSSLAHHQGHVFWLCDYKTTPFLWLLPNIILFFIIIFFVIFWCHPNFRTNSWTRGYRKGKDDLTPHFRFSHPMRFVECRVASYIYKPTLYFTK